MRLKLLEGARAVGNALASMLDMSRSLTVDKSQRAEATNTIKARAAAVVDIVKELEKVSRVIEFTK